MIDEEEGTLIYMIEDLLNIANHEKERHKSSKSDDGVGCISRDSSDLCKDEEIKRDIT